VRSTSATIFAGLREDPFFFDISAFNRFVASVTAQAPNPALLSRGRDTFAGYNVYMIAFDVPLQLLTSNVITVSATTYKSHFPRPAAPTLSTSGPVRWRSSEPFLEQIDRMGLPVVSTEGRTIPAQG
jgi:hypothetical protein